MSAKRVGTTGSLARRYARALVDLAESEGKPDSGEPDSGKLEAFGNSLRSLLEITEEKVPETLPLLEERRIPLATRQKIAEEIGEKMELPPLLKNFWRLLVEKGRATLLPAVVREYFVVHDALLGIVRATATSATPLGLEKEIEKVLQKKLGKKVVLTTKVDPSLLGGLSIRLGNRIFDGSIRKHLERVGETLTQQALS